MITGSDRWYTLGAQLVTAVQSGLTSPVQRAGQVPGAIAWDDCDCGGLLAVTVPRIYFSESFPSEEEAPYGMRCRAPYEVAEYTVSVLRCAPQPGGQEMSPKVSELDSAAGLLLQDAAETMDAVARLMCTLHEADDISDYMLAPVDSAGPEGACVGFVMRVLISLERF